MAVSAWKGTMGRGDHVVQLFEGRGAVWTAVRVVTGGAHPSGLWARLRALREPPWRLSGPCGLRFTGDGTGLVVADGESGRVSMFRVEDGSFVRHVATGLGAVFDVEECEEVAGGARWRGRHRVCG